MLAIGGGIIATVILFRVPVKDALIVFGRQTIATDTLDVLLSFYLITILQKMLEKRERLREAQRSFNCLFRNRRFNTALSSSILGLLPSAAVMTICADMVDQTCGDYLNKKQKMSAACFFRHIPEMFLPTFAPVLLALTLSGVNAGLFVVSMIPMVFVAYALAYIFFLRKIPKEMPPLEQKVVKTKELISLLKNLWTLISVVLIIIIFNLPVWVASLIIIVFNFFIDHFKPRDIPSLLKDSVEPILLGSMYLIMLFKSIITYTGVVPLLPEFFAQFPLPIAMVFGLIFFFGSIISGSQAIIALCLPMAMASVPDGGISLLVLLMCVAWAAMQISPTHVCSFVAAKFYSTTLGDLVIRLIPVVLLFCVITYGYSLLLALF